jgi:transcriptional regulator with XRE-family HTH domain
MGRRPSVTLPINSAALKDIINNMGMTQENIGDLLNVSRQTIYTWLSSSRIPPKQLFILTKELQLSMEQMNRILPPKKEYIVEKSGLDPRAEFVMHLKHATQEGKLEWNRTSDTQGSYAYSVTANNCIVKLMSYAPSNGIEVLSGLLVYPDGLCGYCKEIPVNTIGMQELFNAVVAKREARIDYNKVLSALGIEVKE